MKRKLELVIQEKADFEIVEAYNYYENKLEGLGEHFLNELENGFESILASPNGFQKYDRYRQIPLKTFPFVIVYEVIKKLLIVYAVFQTQRHPDKKLK
jgi:hypothetical protein